MTLMEKAKEGLMTSEMEQVAKAEGVDVAWIMEGLAEGTIVIPRNVNHRAPDPVGIGKGLRTKVNANIGTSPDRADIAEELRKLRVAIEAGTDAVMDLSTGGDISRVRAAILRETTVPLGTVPIYQAAVEAQEKYDSIVAMTADDIFGVIERQAQEGVDFMTVHCGVTLETVERLRKQSRLMDVVSRGGTFMVGWMFHHEEENPLYAQYDRLLEIARRYDVTLSLGDGLRPGCLADATDRPQIQELIIIGELVDRAREASVQVMVEGPGHIPMDQVEANIRLEKRLCRDAPFYVLGPLVTDIAPGYDHIVAAIGGALAAMAGADFICYVTPAEHLALPNPEEVKEGVIAARIAAHAADIARGNGRAIAWDEKMARARKASNWEEQIRLSIDPEKARRYRGERAPSVEETCTMCGAYCAVKLIKEYLGGYGECR
jgi:phosphomethylpyrimidine synthase